MLAERNAWTGAPRVLVDDDARCRRIFISFFHVPASVAAANDLRRRTDCSERQSSRSRDGTKKGFPQHCHDCSVPLFFVYAVATQRHQRQSLRPVPALDFFQKGPRETTVRKRPVPDEGQGTRFHQR